MKRAHMFQHVPFEGLGSIEPWLVEAGYDISATRWFETGVEAPDKEAVDFLIVMGGPMSVNDEAQYPWLKMEKAFIQDFVATGKPVLGICLGAQLIAASQGARVFKNCVTEIGWFPITSVATDGCHFQFPPKAGAFHWHGETFDMPEGAAHLARSEACENQAFQLGDKVIGLQFHLETTRASAMALVENCHSELKPGGPFIQNEWQIMAPPPSRFAAINALMGEVLGYLTIK